MSWIAGIKARLEQLLRPTAADERTDEEFRFHIEMLVRQNVEAGVDPAEARRCALVAFGGVERHREEMRDARRLAILEDVLRDTRYAVRSLRRTPGFSIAAVLTLALGIAATTTMFAVVNAVLLRPLPVSAPERLASVREVQENGSPRSSFSLPAYLEYRERLRGTFTDLAAHHVNDITLTTDGGAEVALGMEVSGNYFRVLGITPAVGQFLTEYAAERTDVEPVAVISHELWRTRFAADPGVIGRALRVNGVPLTIVGVGPRGFHGTMLGARPAVWVPIGLYGRLNAGSDPSRREMTWLQLFGRLDEAVSFEQAETVTGVLARQLAPADRDYRRPGETPVGALVDRFTGIPANGQRDVAAFLTMLLATGGLVLLIAGINVGGMLLARGTARRREMAIRLAIGGTRGRLIRQLLTESVLLAVLGGACGVLIAYWATEYLATIRPPFASFFRLEMPFDARVLAFATASSLLTGILFGIAPALAAPARAVAPAIKEAAPDGHRRGRLRGLFVSGQLALSLMLLIAAGLFARTLQNALSTNHGFDPAGVLALEMNLRLNGYDEERGRAFYAQLLDRVRVAPGVEAAALATMVPLGFSWDQTRVSIPGHEPPQGESGFAVGYNVVSAGYFATLRMPVLAGREFDASDLTGGAARSIVVNETFARRFWPHGSAVGRLVRFGRSDAQIIGVVPDGKYRSLSEPPQLFAYVPFGPLYAHDVWLHARIRGERPAVVAAIREEIAALDPSVPPIVVTTMSDVMESTLFANRLAAGLIGSFGGAGLLLAAVGLFGLLSFSVAQRTREIGVRVALGAGRRNVLALVIGQGMRTIVVGVAVGLLAAAGAARLLRGLLHGLAPLDPVTFLGMSAALVVVAFVAAYIPARRAAAVDPTVALREG